MKILIVTDEFPYPAHKSGNTENIYHIIKHLKIQEQNIRIDLLFIGKAKTINEDRIRTLKTLVDNIYLHNLESSSRIRFSFLIFVKNFGLQEGYDFIFFATFLSGYTRRLFTLKSKYIYYPADSRTMYYSKLKGIKNILRYYKFKIEQKYLYPKFDKIILVSNNDVEEIRKYLDLGDRLISIPVGYELEEDASQIKYIKQYDLIFTGNFHFPPNYLAALYILENIVPKILKIRPGTILCLAGRRPTKEMVEKAKIYSQNVIITGEVESLMPLLHKSRIYISPLTLGSGMKNKILQAMAAALPIIATEESITGFKETRNIIIPKDGNDWINCINSLLLNEELQLHLGRENYSTIKNNYTFSLIVQNYYSSIFKLQEN